MPDGLVDQVNIADLFLQVRERRGLGGEIGGPDGGVGAGEAAGKWSSLGHRGQGVDIAHHHEMPWLAIFG